MGGRRFKELRVAVGAPNVMPNRLAPSRELPFVFHHEGYITQAMLSPFSAVQASVEVTSLLWRDPLAWLLDLLPWSVLACPARSCGFSER